MKKKAKGRPRKKYGHKSEQLIVKLTPASKAGYERAADAAEMNLSEWVRATLDDAMKRQLELSKGSASAGG